MSLWEAAGELGNVGDWSQFGALVVLGLAGLKYLAKRDEIFQKQADDFTERMQKLGDSCHAASAQQWEILDRVSERMAKSQDEMTKAIERLSTHVEKIG